MRRLALAAAFMGLLSSAAVAQGTPPAGCDSPESHQLDFWVGKWEVHPTKAANIVAHSLIEKRYSGCAVRENWMPAGKELTGGGGSLNFYDQRKKAWRQTWIDSTGTRVDFEGNLTNDVMTLTGNWANFSGPGRDAIVQMHYQKQPDGQVRQWAEASTDGGKTWTPAFDLTYRHVAAFPPFK